VRRIGTFLLVALATIASNQAASAQNFDEPLRSSGRYNEGVIGQFDPAASIGMESAAVTAQVAPATNDRPAVLIVKAKIADGRHTYSITQPEGGPLPTRIELDPSSDYRTLDEFRVHPAPNSRVETGPFWTGVEIQEHEGEVAWYVPIEIAAGVEPGEVDVRGTIHLSVCQKGGYCEPVEKMFSAKLAENLELPQAIERAVAQSAIRSPQSEVNESSSAATIGSFQSPASAVKFSGQVTPSTVRPGQSAQLEFTADLPKGSRIYAHADRDEKLGTKPVLIAIESASGLTPHRATTEAAVKSDDSVPQFGPMKYHEGNVMWTVRVDVPESAPGGEYPVRGVIGYQSCEYREDGNNVCELPQAIRFEATLNVGDQSSEAAAPITFMAGGSYADVAKVAARFANSLGAEAESTVKPNNQKPQVSLPEPPVLTARDQYDLTQVRVDASRGSMSYYVALAFVGGIILNLMPCVLPVIGLKVMSFVEQAGKSRTHALVLNLWFAAGIISVFILLAVLASLPQLGLSEEGLGWGGQFGNTAFNVTIAAIVFAMALSLLGVWEVPIPGFFGSGSVHKAAAQEGPLGAFLKGVVTTVLATPCTAPFMAAAVAWAVTQPAATTLTVFASLGLGMASPYILIGVWPELLRFLPKPGAWMETFKQLSGFVLLATVVFILSFIEPSAVVPTILFLLGVAVACWLVARTPLTAEFRERAYAWGGATAMILVFAVGSFGWLYGIANTQAEKGWQPFSLQALKQVAVDGGKTVLVDFSAEWCINCKFFEKTVLHTQPVEQAIARSGVVTMYADYTDYPEEIRQTIRALGANGVPVIAIFPGNAPYEPIVFGGSYSKDGLIAAIQRATGRAGAPGNRSVAEAATIPATGR
jgi:suppressor for copper-sensitivity B